MKSLDELATIHDTCKQSTQAGFAKYYDEQIGHLRDSDISLLEIGVAKGASLRMWRDYFTKATICGIDLNPKCPAVDGTTLLIGSQTDVSFLNALGKSFDIIIDDGSVSSQDKIDTFSLLFPKLNPGGVYVVEHLQHSYLQRVSFVKYIHMLIDALNGYGKYLNGNSKCAVNLGTDYYERNIISIVMYPCIAFVCKTKDIDADKQKYYFGPLES